MTRLVSGVLNAARDRHAAFDAQRNPDPVLLRYLGNFCQEVQGKIMAIDPSYGGIEQTIVFELPLADFDAGMAIGAGRIITDIIAVNKSTEPQRRTWAIPLIAREQRFAKNGPWMAAWQEGENLYLRAPAEGWTNYGSIEVQVVQNFSDDDLATLMRRDSVLPLPDAAAGMVADALALFMATRGHTDPALPPIDVGVFAATARASAEAFYDAVRERNVGRMFITQDVWP